MSQSIESFSSVRGEVNTALRISPVSSSLCFCNTGPSQLELLSARLIHAFSGIKRLFLCLL
ncbi:hypothetical protein X975_19645, partial [Stegodyphus mimosarum]